MSDDLAWVPRVISFFIVGLPALIGVSLLVQAARTWARVRRFTATGERATARVVDNQVESLADGQMRFLPVVTFTTALGADVRTVVGDVGGNRSHLAGSELEIRYDVERPERAFPANRSSWFLVGWVITGLVFLGFALVAYKLAGTVVDGFNGGGGPGGSGDGFGS